MAETQQRETTSLRDRCVAEALKVVETSGVESLSLREVSRRLGVSHQAPYKHFPSRDHLLAEIVARVFEEFAQHLENRPRFPDPHDDLRSMGESYVRYALEHPLHYRLLFATPHPNAEEHPEMTANAQRAFGLLREALGQLDETTGLDDESVEHDALFVWSTIHGLASILQSDALCPLELDRGTVEHAAGETLLRIGRALRAGDASEG